MDSFHTVIVGAGPGGLACAAALARQGVRVLVLERNATIGPKVCAGGIPSSARKIIPAEAIEKSFCRQLLVTNRQRYTIQADTPVILTADRHRLGQWMADQAIKAGAVVHTATPVKRITAASVLTAGSEYRYRFLVGADGSSSLVRRFLGLTTQKVGVGIHYQVPGNFDRLEWHLNTKLFGNGYAWIFPHSRSASIGVYASRSGVDPKSLLAKLDVWAHKYGIETGTARQRAALINYDYRGWRFGNRFLVGDAAGLASGLTGEGIFSAIISGEAVAATILDPAHEDQRLQQLIAKHRRHTRFLELYSKGRWRSSLMMESLLLALRFGWLHFTALEMGVE